MEFRPDIQGLRAISILAVIIFHLNPAWLSGGFVGVDIFLVISGYLIASILLHKKNKPEYRLAATLDYFYSSRFKRIVPTYFATLILVSLLAAVLFLPADFSIYRDSLKKAVWFNSNNYFAGFGDYFAPANHEQPLLHTWSLAIEIQFYLLAPFIYLLIPKQLLRWLLPAAVILLTAYAEYRLQQGVQQATYYSLLARLPAFFIGGWVALMMAKRNYNSGLDRQNLWLSCFAVALITFAFVIPKPTGCFPGIAGLIPVTATALLIWLNTNNRVTAFLSSKTLVWIGTLSYSLYLWHWPVLAFMRYYTGAEILDWQFSLAFIGMTLVLAIVSYYWIEKPLRQKRSKMQLVGYACLVLIALGTGAGIKKMNAHLTPELLPVEYRRYADPETICHGKIVGNCLKGDLTSDKEMLVLGDSHAAMLNNFFDYLGNELGFKARIITASSCVTYPGFDYERIPEWAKVACARQIQEVNKYIDNARFIVVAGMWSYQFSFDTFYDSLSHFLTAEKARSIYFMPQVPLLNINHQRVRRFNALGLKNSAVIDVNYIQANKLLHELLAPYMDVRVIDVRYAGEEWLKNISDIYRDESHLNEKGAVKYARINRDVFNALIDRRFDE